MELLIQHIWWDNTFKFSAGIHLKDYNYVQVNCILHLQVQFVPYICEASLFRTICYVLFSIIFAIMSYFSVTRSVLLKVRKYPIMNHNESIIEF